MSEQTSPVARRLGHWVAESGAEHPGERCRAARMALLDVTACMLPGAAAGETLKTIRAAGVEARGPNRLIGRTGRATESSAALVNGTAAHALDFDDNFEPAFAHASAVLAPALFAVGETIRASGSRLIDAYLAGLQVMARVGFGVNPIHRLIGWHATSTVGAVGVAAACARLLRLDADAATAALSLATSSAAGSSAQFGTDAKPLHAGLAARAGVFSARLAEAGMRGAEDVFEHALGFRRLYLGESGLIEQFRRKFPDQGERWPMAFDTDDMDERHAIETHGLQLKRWPNCGSAHEPMQGLLGLIREYDLGPEDIATVGVSVSEAARNNLRFDRPATPAQARFSLPWALACLIEDGDLRLDHFTPAALDRPDLRSRIEQIRVYTLPRPEQAPAEDRAATIETRTHAGRIVSKDVAWNVAPGCLANPLSWRDLVDKLRDCAAAATVSVDSEEIAGVFERLDDLVDVNELTALLCIDSRR